MDEIEPGDAGAEESPMAETSQLVLNYFGLREQPFAATADPAYFYATKRHKECLFRLWNHIDERQGIAVVLGSYGTGKTTLLRKVLTGFQTEPEKYDGAVIGSPLPTWTSFSLLEHIVGAFQLTPAESTIKTFMEELSRRLLGNRKRITTLIIDDAQNLNKRGQLELLRLTQNLETRQCKLLNLVFFAQLEWVPILRAAPNFMQRINVSFTLEPIGVDEVGDLIAYRLRLAGAGERGPVFEESAVRAIYAYSKGNPRLIVTLCRNSLLAAARLRTRQIGQAIILHTVETTMPPDPERKAYLAAALSEPPGIPSNAPNTPEAPHDVQSAPTPDEARANRMLLKGVRANLGRSGTQEKP